MKKEVTVGCLFSYYKNVPIGTKLIISDIVDDNKSASKKSFIVEYCSSNSWLNGKKIATSLIKDYENIVEEFELYKNNQIEKKLLLII